MNSNDLDFDWHRAGVWVALDAKQDPHFETMAASPYSCRASLLGRMNKRWSALRADGWVIQEFVPATTSPVTVKDEVAVNAETRWRYPANGEAAPAGATVQLLTRGRVSVRGVWTDSGDFIAWAPMIKRDKDLEARLGL